MRMPGVTCVMKSCSRVPDPRKTLSVYVSRSVISGVTVQFAAAALAVVSARRAAPASHRLAPIARGAVIGKDIGLWRLVQHRQHDGAGLERRKRTLERRMRGSSG